MSEVRLRLFRPFDFEGFSAPSNIYMLALRAVTARLQDAVEIDLADDELRIEHDHGIVEIVVYNRAILLFTTESEAVRRIHRSAVASKTWRVVSGMKLAGRFRFRCQLAHRGTEFPDEPLSRAEVGLPEQVAQLVHPVRRSR